MKIALAALALMCGISTFVGCAQISQPGTLPSPEEECARVGGTWAHSLCRYRGQ